MSITSSIASALEITEREFLDRCRSLPLQLKDYQREWGFKALLMLLNNRFYFDTSAMRSGKSYVAMWVASYMGVRVFVVAPVTTHQGWRDAIALSGVECEALVSYEGMKGIKGKETKGLYMSSEVVEDEFGEDKTIFTTTKRFNKLVEQSMLVIFDESQCLKNDSDQNHAAAAMIEAINSSKSQASRFAMLSGTPFDKDPAIILKMAGVIKAPFHYERNRYGAIEASLTEEGLQDMIEECLDLDEDKTNEIVAQGYSTLDTFCELYFEVFKEAVVGSMIPPTPKGEISVKNGFYLASAKASAYLKTAVDDMKSLLKLDAKGNMQVGKGKIGAFTKLQVMVERIKVPSMARVASSALDNNPRLKVVIAINYKDSCDRLLTLLTKYNPMVIMGDVKEQDRAKAVKQFSTNPKVRVIVMNITLGVGISLYNDNNPNEPRLMLLSPCYRAISIAQSVSRIYGPGMEARAEARLFYCQGEGRDESEINSGLMRSVHGKSVVMKRALDNQLQKDTILPCDYEDEDERGPIPVDRDDEWAFLSGK